MYTWDKQDVLAAQAGMPPTSMRNALSDLRKWGIVYVAQATLSDANSYRLTDSAFKMAQTLQTLALFCNWQHQLGHEKSNISTDPHAPKWQRFVRLLDDLPRGNYQQWFTDWIGSDVTQTFIAQWHNSNDGAGQRQCPSQLPIRDYALMPVSELVKDLESPTPQEP